jgi:GxxExxY protein
MGTIDPEKLAEMTIGFAMKVHRKLGPGYVESVYKNALLVEFGRANIPATRELPMKVNYEGVIVGEFFADLVVDHWLILEIKLGTLNISHELQLVNYLTVSNSEFGLLFGFGGQSLEYKRKYRRRAKPDHADPPPDLHS